MSKTTDTLTEEQDSLSAIIRQIGFSARVFFRDGYCGEWAVDTSGSTQVPFHLVCEGEGWLHGSDLVPRKLKAGQLVFFPQDDPHILAATADLPEANNVNRPPPEQLNGEVTRLVCGYFEFDRRSAAPLLNGLPKMMILDLSDCGDQSTRELVNLWMREAANKSLGGDLAVDRYAELVFMQILRVEISTGRLQGVIGALGDAKLGAALADIHRSPGDVHSLVNLALRAGMSESAFAARFKRRVGMTPGQYVKHWRMQSAAAMLVEGSAGMYEIANEVGYQSEVAFRKAFSAHFGIAPGKFRRDGKPDRAIK